MNAKATILLQSICGKACVRLLFFPTSLISRIFSRFQTKQVGPHALCYLEESCGKKSNKLWPCYKRRRANPSNARLLQGTVFSFGMKVCGQRQDAEDTMQEVLLKSVPNLPKFDSPKALMVWLYKVAKSRCLMSRRKSKFAPKEALSLEELMPDQREMEELSGNVEPTAESSLIRRENANQLRDAVHQLPPDYRLILVLHDMEELSDDDIAEITGLRPGTIRVRLHRARLFVRKELAKSTAGQRSLQAKEASGSCWAASS
jgi:RNA polymerase sigma factor (sigma-70 family)